MLYNYYNWKLILSRMILKLWANISTNCNMKKKKLILNLLDLQIQIQAIEYAIKCDNWLFKL